MGKCGRREMLYNNESRRLPSAVVSAGSGRRVG